MIALRLLFSLVGGAVVAMLVVAVGAMAAMVAAISTGGRIEVPGLVLAQSGEGSDLGNVQFLPPGAVIWFAILTVAGAAVTFLVGRRAWRAEKKWPSARS